MISQQPSFALNQYSRVVPPWRYSMTSLKNLLHPSKSNSPQSAIPNQTLVAFFHLPTSKWRRLWSGLGKFLKAGYSLPVCLFLNLGILACSFFSFVTAKFVRGQDPKRETAEEHSLWRHRASSKKPPDSVLYVCNITHLHACSSHSKTVFK